MPLRATINALASEFAHALVRALRNASLDEIVAETHSAHRATTPARPSRAPRARGGRLARRSDEDLKHLTDRIVTLVAGAKDGMSAEALKASLKIERKELPRPLAMALASKKIRKRGQRRATKYFRA